VRAPRVETRRFTRVEYDRLIDQGFFDEDERIELLDGLLVVREPQGSQHAVAVELARAALQGIVGKGYHVRGQSPVALDASPIGQPPGAGSTGASRCSGRAPRSRPSRRPAAAFASPTCCRSAPVALRSRRRP
jgi:hypothetical protein